MMNNIIDIMFVESTDSWYHNIFVYVGFNFDNFDLKTV